MKAICSSETSVGFQRSTPRCIPEDRTQESFGLEKLLLVIMINALKHYTTSRKVPGSSPNEVDFFNLPNPSSRSMTLGSTKRLTEMSTRNLPG
jgi:hypothetical protein